MVIEIMNPYIVENKSIVGRNRRYFNNRPLYGDHRPSYVIAGDRPYVRLFVTLPQVRVAGNPLPLGLERISLLLLLPFSIVPQVWAGARWR